jgi:predicted nucleic acid-binding protein
VIIVDTGPLYAVADHSDGRHRDCVSLFDGPGGPFIVPQTVLTETCWLIEARLGPEYEARFLESFTRGELVAEAVTAGDVDRIIELVRRYADFPLGTVDASVVAVAERLGVSQLATLDRAHFSAVRPRHITAFELLP